MARATYRHPVNKAMIDEAPRSARIVDEVTGFMGSWRFIIVQTVIVAIWLILNIFLLAQPFDPYPFILLNLAFSTQAAYASVHRNAGRRRPATTAGIRASATAAKPAT